MQKTEILIVGAGLSGLHTAAILSTMGRDVLLIDARSRLGGRVLSMPYGGATYDLGPAWFWPGQAHVDHLISEFALATFAQQSAGGLIYEEEGGVIQRVRAAPMDGAFRIEGGMVALISALANRIPVTNVQLGSRVRQIRHVESGVETNYVSASGQNEIILSERVILALPPRLVSDMNFDPPLAPALHSTWKAIPSWMAGHAKFLAWFDTPFWRDQGLSGSAISQRGPLMEIHDASPARGGPHALFGFVGTPARQRIGRDKELTQESLAQLIRLFGEAAGKPLASYWQDWAQDRFTASELDWEPLNHHPAYGYLAQTFDLWDSHVLLSGTETAAQYGGFLEGALDASIRTLSKVTTSRF